MSAGQAARTESTTVVSSTASSAPAEALAAVTAAASSIRTAGPVSERATPRVMVERYPASAKLMSASRLLKTADMRRYGGRPGCGAASDSLTGRIWIRTPCWCRASSGEKRSAGQSVSGHLRIHELRTHKFARHPARVASLSTYQHSRITFRKLQWHRRAGMAVLPGIDTS